MATSIKTLATSEDINSLRKDISESIADIFKWMLIFWIVQIVATLAIAFLFLNK